jgi:hypothetical protein
MANRTFVVTEEHIKLLKAMCVAWQDCEYGAPEIDPKRPYGNSSVECDIHEILTDERNYELTDEQRERYSRLHHETQIALEIMLQCGELRPGTYDDVRALPYAKREWSSKGKSERP